MIDGYLDFHLQLSPKDAAKLADGVERSGLTRAGYVRLLINNRVPTDKPPPDFFQMARELHTIGRNLNQIAKRANVNGDIDVGRYEKMQWSCPV